MLRAESLTTASRRVDRALVISPAEKRMMETQCAFVDAAKAAGVPYVAKLSGKELGIGFDPGRFQGTQEHVEIEHHLEASGLAWTHALTEGRAPRGDHPTSPRRSPFGLRPLKGVSRSNIGPYAPWATSGCLRSRSNRHPYGR